MPRLASVWHKKSRMSKLAGISLLWDGASGRPNLAKPYGQDISDDSDTDRGPESPVAKRQECTTGYKGKIHKR